MVTAVADMVVIV